MQACFGQAAVVKAAAGCEGEFAEIGFPFFEVEVGTHERERAGQSFRDIEKLVHTFRFGNREILGSGKPLFVEALQFPFAVEEIERRFGLLPTTVAAQHVFGLAVEAVELIVGRGVSVFCVNEFFAE